MVDGGITLISSSDDQLVITSLELLGFYLGSICLDLLSTAVPLHHRLRVSHHLHEVSKAEFIPFPLDRIYCLENN